MMVRKLFKIHALILMLLTSSCKFYRYYVTSTIKGKEIAYTTPYNQYYFIFRERKEYKKRILFDDYNKYKIDDKYTFEITKNEQEYFYKENVQVLS